MSSEIFAGVVGIRKKQCGFNIGSVEAVMRGGLYARKLSFMISPIVKGSSDSISVHFNLRLCDSLHGFIILFSLFHNDLLVKFSLNCLK